ncbi:hypothetical protein BD311DRAFT_810671 [Dichomitus squalens]|uniref:DUF6593 domain-containing protein n=1 Tax=Dichomitus squalens TaxID=114155 RepID=A0A4Q9MCL2_9APHY|nr:hypothetical protein BD311DRAFT_810671 [Dichomitus squalens]
MADSFGLTVSFLRDEPLNSTVVDAMSGETLYEISTTRRRLQHDTTTIRDARSPGEVAATWEHKALGHDTITIRGKANKVSNWVSAKGVFSKTWTVASPQDPGMYHWRMKDGSSELELIHNETNTVVAESHHGYESKGTLMRIDVSADVAHMLDSILLSFVILEERRRREGKSPVADAIAGAGGYTRWANSGGRAGNVFADWEQKSFRRDQVTFHGVRCKLSKWLRKRNILSSTRVLVAPDGEEFHWKEKPITFELVSMRTRTPIARSHNAHSAVGQLLSLSVAPSAVPMLDAILLSFVILEQRRREELGGASATGGAAYTASGTSAANVSSP